MTRYGGRRAYGGYISEPFHLQWVAAVGGSAIAQGAVTVAAPTPIRASDFRAMAVQTTICTVLRLSDRLPGRGESVVVVRLLTGRAVLLPKHHTVPPSFKAIECATCAIYPNHISQARLPARVQ